MSARNDDLGAAVCLAHLQDVGTHPLVEPVVLAGNLLTLGKESLSPAKVQGHALRHNVLNSPVDELSLALDIAIKKDIALGLADALQNDLFSCLGSDTSEVFGCALDHN